MLDWMLLGVGVTGALLASLLVVTRLLSDSSPKHTGLRGWMNTDSVREAFANWERSPLPLLSLFLLLGVIVAFTMRAPQLENTITLPIEVIGPDGHTESVTVDVADPSQVDRLYIKGHKLGYHKSDYAENNGYDKKASFRINGGSWIPINNDNFSAKYPESKYYSGQLTGPIGGPWSVLRGTLPISNTGALQSGANTIEFRFNETEGMTSGYRILDLDLQTSGGTSQIDGTTFKQVDPDTWEAPYTSSSAIADGKEYWNARNTLLERPGGRSIVASCSDCHAQDGRDLKYFNFSNKSIVARAEFHGISAEKGRKIASYIRTRTLTLPDGYTVSDAGRPWNPPYQPGPGLKDEPVELWAAGAGMKWVLEDDLAMYPLLYPSASDRTVLQSLDGVPENPESFLASLEGTRNQNQMLTRTHTDSTINVDELPISEPLPDVFEWWPDEHPMDYLPGGESAFNNSKWVSYYERWRSEMEKGPAHIESLAEETAAAIKDENYKYEGLMGLGVFFTESSYLSEWEWPSDWDTVDDDVFRQKLSFEQWRLLKTWEIMQEFNLQDYGDEMFTDNPDGLRAGGKDRTWFIQTSLYDLAPHKNGKPGYSVNGAFATECQNLYFSSSWYEVATILNTGNRLGTQNDPFDWNYHHTHIGADVNCYGHDQSLRYMKAQILVQQQRANFRGITGSKKGWDDWHVISPQRSLATGGKAAFLSSAMPKDLRFDVAESILRAHTIETLRYDTDNYPRGGGNLLRPSDYTPQLKSVLGIGWPNRTDAQYTMTSMLAEAGGRATLVDSMARWGEKMWPNGNWEQWMLDESTNRMPTVSLNSPSAESTYTEAATLSLSAGAKDPDGSINKVVFYNGRTKLGEVTSSPFEYNWTDVPAGAHLLSAEATDDKGATQRSAATEITVTSTGTASNGVHFTYYEGEWSNLPAFRSKTPVNDGTAPSFATSVRSRDDNFGLRFTSYIEIPPSETGTYTFYTTSDDGSQLLVDGEQVVNNDGLHAAEEKSGTVSLEAGWHKVVVEYFERTGAEETLDVSWKGPAFTKQVIPESRLFLAPEVSQPSQTIALEAGWNVVSSRVMPDPSDLETVFGNVSVGVVESASGKAYVPAEGLNEIGSWDATEAYKVYTESSQSLTLEGTSVDDTTRIPLQKGWNLVPYLPEEAQSIDKALQSISDELVILKDESGDTYLPAYGIDQIGQLQPTEGYQIYVDAPVDLVYPSESSTTAAMRASSESSDRSFSTPQDDR